MASLTFDGVGKTYGDRIVAIANVSFTIADGEFVVLVGPSGCGKSTLLRMAAGLEELSGGRLLMDDRDVTHVGPEDRDIAMVFQNYALYPHMSVYDNMAFGLQQRKTPKDVVDRQVREAAEMLDLSRYLERKPGALSGGQRQRVAMGRAIVRHPACFLMDEPLSNLDAKLRVQMRSELKLLNQRLGVTTLYVTHDQVEAMTMGDRVAVLQPIGDAGQSNLQQIDTPQILYDRPVNMFVAGFIGSPAMNFLRVDLTREGERIAASVAGTGQRVVIPATPALARYCGQRAVLGIRPEAFEPCDEGEAVFHETVPVAEALGADTFVFFDIDSPPIGAADVGEAANLTAKGRSRLIARIPPARTPRPNERMALRVNTDKLHWFDPATGLAIRD